MQYILKKFRHSLKYFWEKQANRKIIIYKNIGLKSKMLKKICPKNKRYFLSWGLGHKSMGYEKKFVPLLVQNNSSKNKNIIQWVLRILVLKI